MRVIFIAVQKGMNACLYAFIGTSTNEYVAPLAT